VDEAEKKKETSGERKVDERVDEEEREMANATCVFTQRIARNLIRSLFGNVVIML